MAFVFYALFALAAAGLDQVTKLLVVRDIPLHGDVPLLPGVLGLTHVHNDGAAFSSLRGMQGLFILIFLVFTGAVVYEYFRKRLPFTRFDRVCIAAVYGGGLGNLIDRVRLGYVVDMFNLEFIHYPVFNVADCCIVVGAVLAVVYYLWFYEKYDKREGHHGTADSQSNG